MNIRIFITALLVGAALSGCYLGGGGGKYYPQGVSVGTIEVSKTDLKGTRRNVSAQRVLGGDIDRYNILRFESDPPDDEFRAGLLKYYYSRMFVFDDENYKLAVPITNRVSIFDSKNTLVAKLRVPRYSTDAHAFEVAADGRSMLVVYVDQQATSHSSTLFILNDKFDIVYKEHLLSGHWIAAPVDRNLSGFVVAADKSWLVDDVWVDVGGPWRYSLGER